MSNASRIASTLLLPPGDSCSSSQSQESSAGISGPLRLPGTVVNEAEAHHIVFNISSGSDSVSLSSGNTPNRDKLEKSSRNEAQCTVEKGSLPSSVIQWFELEAAQATQDSHCEDSASPQSRYCYSAGSKDHPDSCRPCAFLLKTVGCRNADSCTFCHLDHEFPKAPRPSKPKRDECKRLVEETIQALSDNPQKLTEVCLGMAVGNPYMQRYMAKIPELAEALKAHGMTGRTQRVGSVSSKTPQKAEMSSSKLSL